MRDFFGGFLRCLTLLLVVGLIVGIIAGGLWLLLRDHTPVVAEGQPTITTKSLEQTGLGLYLQLRQQDIITPMSDDATMVGFHIDPGETPATIGTRLQNMGLIRDEQLFRLLVRYWGVDDKLEAGDYQLRRNMSMEEIVAALQHGMARAKTITIPEGWRLEQVAQLAAREGIVSEDEFLHLARNGSFDFDFLADRPADVTSLEGYLFPDTYQVGQDTSTAAFVEMLLRNFGQRVTPELRQRAGQSKMTLYQVVTLASIVEREAVLDEERPVIASVFLNRLAKGMYLQADPTVEYAKGFSTESGRWWNPMRQEDAQAVKSPYNTFLYPGLPPGPICSPGLASIKAVLEPADTPYLFFVAKGDGSHVFAVTYEEHVENVYKYNR